jgi:tagatose-1,6-bisphosphate aldolase non-catalytic subunit AgaZ/GatZ
MVGLGRPSEDTNQEKTVMQKNYQTTTTCARSGRTMPKKVRLDAGRSCAEAAIALPDTVTVAELAGELEDGLLAFVVGTGLKVLDVVLESDPDIAAALVNGL